MMLDYFKKINWRNVLERALWTFVEGFIVGFPALDALGTDPALWKSACIGAAMTGGSAVKTLIVEMFEIRRESENGAR